MGLAINLISFSTYLVPQVSIPKQAFFKFDLRLQPPLETEPWTFLPSLMNPDTLAVTPLVSVRSLNIEGDGCVAERAATAGRFPHHRTARSGRSHRHRDRGSGRPLYHEISFVCRSGLHRIPSCACGLSYREVGGRAYCVEAIPSKRK